MKIRYAVALAAMLLPVPVEAQPHLKGSEFLSACTIPEQEWIGFCHGYVQAVFDGIRRPGENYCVPEGVTRAQIVGDVVTMLASTPATEDLSAYSVVYAVLLQRYPC